MSYCRFSSDNWQCDVYAYESRDGFEVHVAAHRYTDDIPKLPAWNADKKNAYFEAYKIQIKAVDASPMRDIGGKYDGMHFIYATLEDLLTGLADIKEAGYNVPQFVFDQILEEMVKQDG